MSSTEILISIIVGVAAFLTAFVSTVASLYYRRRVRSAETGFQIAAQAILLPVKQNQIPYSRSVPEVISQDFGATAKRVYLETGIRLSTLRGDGRE